MSEEKYQKATRIIVKAGAFPFPITDTLVGITKELVSEDELDFILAFKRKVSQTLEELEKSSNLPKEVIIEKADSLAKKGLIFNQPNSQGIIIYRLMSLMLVGVFEYAFMKKLDHNDKEKKIARLFHKAITELKDFIQDQYDTIAPYLTNLPPIDRTIPVFENIESRDAIEVVVDHEINSSMEDIVVAKNIEELINKFDDIAVAYCYCRQYKQLLGEPCKINAPLENCFTFGKSARFIAQQGFGRLISKSDALKIMREAEDHGLIHKAIHTHQDIKRDETSLCNCCPCCCETLNLWKNGINSMVNSTNYLSIILQEKCTGCGICVEKCPVDAIHLNDANIAERDETRCLGCGVCARFCPEQAISLQEGQRKVAIPPVKIKR
jgi:ferredoxin